MSKWTWALLFIFSVAAAGYFIMASKPNQEKVVPAKIERGEPPAEIVPKDETFSERPIGQGTSPLSGEPRMPQPAPVAPPPPIQNIPSNQFEPPQYEPPPPPPPSQYEPPMVDPYPYNETTPPPFEYQENYPEPIPPPPPPAQPFSEEELY